MSQIFMLIIAILYQLSIMSTFFIYLRALGTLFILPKICPGLTVINNILSVRLQERKLKLGAIQISRAAVGDDRGAAWRGPAKFEPRPRRSDVARKRASERAERVNALLLLPLLLRANCLRATPFSVPAGEVVDSR